jgi:tRNA pseudouridine55 synthase
MTARHNTGGGDPSGLLLIHKKPGLTSFQALDAIKERYAGAKAGHTGALDKFASGLLLALLGRAVKLAPWLSNCDKYYEGTIRFGLETDTLDGEGRPVAEGAVPSPAALEQALARFRGDILQAPPEYSAIHIRGKRAYERIRAGETLEMPKRPVTVYALELVAYDPPLAHIRVHCSKGTYIRSLARDIARAADSRAYLAALRRTGIAGLTLPEIPDSAPPPLRPLEPELLAALGIPSMIADEPAVHCLMRGQRIDPLIASLSIRRLMDRTYWSAGKEPCCAGVFNQAGDFIALIEQKTPAQASAVPCWSYGYVYAHL